MKQDVAYYLDKGFDLPTAKYFAEGRRSITNVVPCHDFTLKLTFDNGEIRILDAKTFLKPDTIFAHIMDFADFQRVYLDEDGAVCWDIDPTVDSNVIWSNKIDICPDGCYLDSVAIN